MNETLSGPREDGDLWETVSMRCDGGERIKIDWEGKEVKEESKTEEGERYRKTEIEGDPWLLPQDVVFRFRVLREGVTLWQPKTYLLIGGTCESNMCEKLFSHLSMIMRTSEEEIERAPAFTCGCILISLSEDKGHTRHITHRSTWTDSTRTKATGYGQRKKNTGEY